MRRQLSKKLQRIRGMWQTTSFNPAKLPNFQLRLVLLQIESLHGGNEV